MENGFNSPKNYPNKRSIYKTKMKKYITVQRIKPKDRKLSIISERDKEEKNNICFSDTNEINEELKKRRKTISSNNIAFDHIINPINNNINDYRRSFIFIYPNELDNYNINKKSIIGKKNILPNTNKNSNKEKIIIPHIESYFSTKGNNKPNSHSNINKKNKYIKKNNIISKTLINIKENKTKSKMDNNINYNTNNSNSNNLHLMHRVTKDTIFEKENLDPNWYNTISNNLNHDNDKPKKNNDIKERNNNRNIDKYNNNENQTKHTIIFRKNNSALLTFGNTNDSLSESFSKTSNINDNYLLILKQENESLKYELMKTKQKVDVLENKIEYLIYENNTNNNICPKPSPDVKKYEEEDLNKLINNKHKNKNKHNNLSRMNNKISLKSYQSQKNFKLINNDKKDNNKNNNSKNPLKCKTIGRTFSSVFDIKKTKINKFN